MIYRRILYDPGKAQTVKYLKTSRIYESVYVCNCMLFHVFFQIKIYVLINMYIICTCIYIYIYIQIDRYVMLVVSSVAAT